MSTSIIDYESDYRPVKKLGEGTYGSVWGMVNEYTPDTIAAKYTVLEDRHDEPTIAATVREVAIATTLGADPNINKVLHFAPHVEEGEYSLFMERMDGSIADMYSTLPEKKSAADILRRNMKSVLRQILLGVHAMHRVGVIHRDLKPQNILYKIGEDGGVKVTIADFGMSKFIGIGEQREEGRLFTAGVVTWPFRPPEIDAREMKATYGLEVDAWSVGAVFLCLLIGQFPLMCYTLDERHFAYAHACFERDGPSGLAKRRGKGADPTLLDLVERLMQKEPARRIRIEDALKHSYFTEAAPGKKRGMTPARLFRRLSLKKPAERQPAPSLHSFATPEGLDWSGRFKTVGAPARESSVWMIKRLCEEYKYGPRTLRDAAVYMDIHMESYVRKRDADPGARRMDSDSLVLTCVAAFVLSAMLNEVEPPYLGDICKYMRKKYPERSADGFFVSEDDILSTMFAILGSSGNRLVAPATAAEIVTLEETFRELVAAEERTLEATSKTLAV